MNIFLKKLMDFIQEFCFLIKKMRETEKKMGWKLIAGNLHISESIEFCEQHNMPILEGMIKK